MILADTSVWIRAALGRDGCSVALDGLLSVSQVVGHELVYGELLIGDLGGRGRSLALVAELPWVGRLPHPHVVALVRAHRLHGRGIDWTDAHLMASALAAGEQLWTADERLAAIARELKCGWSPK